MTDAGSGLDPGSCRHAIMLRTALRQASVRFSASISPSALIGMPMKPRNRSGAAKSGPAKKVSRENTGAVNLRRLARPLCSLKRTTAVAPISTAVTQTSPSPWAKCPSPVENSPPSLNTGRNSFAPLVNCLTSKLPPFSRGGKVRRPARPEGPVGTAPAGSGGRANPPLSMTRCSRAVHSASFSTEGATADTPMNGAPGMRTPGICAEVAQLSAIRQCTRNGSVITSRRKPSPGTIAQKAEPRHDRAERRRLRDDVGELNFENVAGHRALNKDRSGQRVHGAGVERGELGSDHPRLDLAVHRIPRLQRDLLAHADLDHRCDVRIVAVVAANALERMPRTIDVAAQVPHHPLRVYVMGDRAIRRE